MVVIKGAVECYTCGKMVVIDRYKGNLKCDDITLVVDGVVVCKECASKLGFMRRNI